VQPAGDLDGDGKADLTGWRVDAQADGSVEVTVVAMRGTTGARLWRRVIPGAVAATFPRLLGPKAVPGVLVATYDTRSEQGGAARTYDFTQRLVALGGDGTELWQRTFQGSAQATDVAVLASDIPLVMGTMQADPSPADDVLMSVEDIAVTPAETSTTTDAVVVSGADGSTISTSSIQETDRESMPVPAPDLSGDGLDDVVALVAPLGDTTGYVAAFRGTDGGELWRDTGVPVTIRSSVRAVGDVSGDGSTDLAVWTSPYAERAMRLFVLEGATGAVVWAKRADAPRGLGDIDGDGLADVGAQTPTSFKAGRWGVRYQAYDASGHPIYSRSYTIPLPPGDVFAVITLSPDVGRVNADPAEDASHAVLLLDTDQGKLFRDRGVVSGQSGSKLWSGAVGVPLHGSVDGQGDDLALLDRSGRDLRIIAQDGASGRPIWSRRLHVPVSAGAVVSSADLNGDDRAEVIVNTVFLGSSGGYEAFVLSGRTGRVLWSI
jgi:hypothetical protein